MNHDFFLKLMIPLFQPSIIPIVSEAIIPVGGNNFRTQANRF